MISPERKKQIRAEIGRTMEALMIKSYDAGLNSKAETVNAIRMFRKEYGHA